MTPTPAVDMKYRMYIDEVGNADLESSDDPNHRFLSLTGVVVDLDYVASFLQPQMEEIKSRYFESHPDDPVILHRKELIGGHRPFGRLRDTSTRQRFDADLLRLLADWDYQVVTVCIDKKRHKETYSTWRYDPYHYCMEVLLERLVFFLNRRRASGDVMAESRGGREARRLKASYERLWSNGTNYVEPAKFQSALTSRQLKVKQKANNIAGLQLADLIAHPSRNEILRDHNLLLREIGAFAARIIEILQEKYDQEAGRLFGKKLL